MRPPIAQSDSSAQAAKQKKLFGPVAGSLRHEPLAHSELWVHGARPGFAPTAYAQALEGSVKVEGSSRGTQA